MLIVADAKETFLITGSGDVLDPEYPVIAVGSGGNYALAAGRALYDQMDDAEAIARKAMDIAADICVYTNRNLTIESLSA
jgi:ATP-dependent HslUV protease subunit HslV